MPECGGTHLFLYQDCVIRVPFDAPAPKYGSLLLARHLPLREGDVVLDLGAGSGLIGILAAKRGHRVVATDRVPDYARHVRANALLNGVGAQVDVRTGDLFAPIHSETFDVIAANPPQLPTPPDSDWNDPQSWADNGGCDGWLHVERIIRESPPHLKPRGRLVLALFAFLGTAGAFQRLRDAGLEPTITAQEEQPFPRLARERLAHIRSVCPPGAVPDGHPSSCLRMILCGTKG